MFKVKEIVILLYFYNKVSLHAEGELPKTWGDIYLCKNATIDAIFAPRLNPSEQPVFVLQGYHYWKLIPLQTKGMTIAPGWPHDLVEIGFPEEVYDFDAVISWKRTEYFFKGSKVWKFSNEGTKNKLEGPEEISESFPGIPDNLDAAMIWDDSTGVIYFFKGDEYWKFDATAITNVAPDYPKRIYDRWEGIPQDIDAAYHTKTGFTYFFKDGEYYKFNDNTSKVVDNEVPLYPRKSGQWWFGCPDPKLKEDLDICKEDQKNYDTISLLKDGNETALFAFKGLFVWKLVPKGNVFIVHKEYPKVITDKWEHVPENIDAAFYYVDGSNYFLKGSKVWKYTEGDIHAEGQGYPKEISEEFPGIPNDVDAAFPWFVRPDIYFFKGDRFWRYDPKKSTPVSSSYPKPIAIWPGIPESIDAAFTNSSNNHVYFFERHQYYKFDALGFKVVNDKPPYPRHVGPYLFECKS